MKKSNLMGALIIGAVLATPVALADTPKSLEDTHGHAANVTGKITLYRNQVKGMEIGPEGDRLDAETLVVLDSKPGMVFGIRNHEADQATHDIIETLREAFLNGRTVTIQHGVAPGKNNLKINWVQMEK